MKVRLLVLGSLLTLLTGCSSAEDPGGPAPSQLTQDVRPAAPSESTTDSPAAAPLMPDLVGMPSAKAGERLGELGLGSTWGRPVVVRCQARPRTVVRQRPAAGTTLTPDTTVHVRTAAMDLDRFRGPCEPLDKLVGPVAEADLELAREFYRFAADPSLGSAFADGGVWVGIEDGLKSTRLVGSELGELAAWELDTGYAERSGPFSALDTLALSGGYYEVRDGVAGTCPAGNDKAPPELDGLRAISLTAPDDVTSACLEWWGVTLFLDPQNLIRGVALRLGSP